MKIFLQISITEKKKLLFFASHSLQALWAQQYKEI